MSLLQYLTSYAEPESRIVPPRGCRFGQVVVLPLFDESSTEVDDLLRSLPGEGTLCICVVNCAEDRSDDEMARTDYLAQRLAEGAESIGEGAFVRPVGPKNKNTMLLIDRAREGRKLPSKEGVGLARKIGCDVSLAWHGLGVIESPWIHTTDADVTLPPDYFEAAHKTDADVAALVYHFWHQCEPTSLRGRALALYECRLRYYRLGLSWAGSPYAFHTIGSCMAVRHHAYWAVRGVPKRLAGEDFYLLNKVAKVGPVRSPKSRALLIHQRSSHRTPFGTGPATEEIFERLRRGEEMTVYNPRSFALVREWLDALEDFAESGDLGILDRLSHRELRDALPLDVESRLRGVITQRKESAGRKEFLRTWFDGFRTLKLIHALRSQGLDDVTWSDAVQSAPFVPDVPMAELRKALAEQESVLA